MAFPGTDELLKSMVWILPVGIFLEPPLFGRLTHRFRLYSWMHISLQCYTIYLIHSSSRRLLSLFIGSSVSGSYFGQLSIHAQLLRLLLIFICSSLLIQWIEQPVLEEGRKSKKSVFFQNFQGNPREANNCELMKYISFLFSFFSHSPHSLRPRDFQGIRMERLRSSWTSWSRFALCIAPLINRSEQRLSQRTGNHSLNAKHWTQHIALGWITITENGVVADNACSSPTDTQEVFRTSHFLPPIVWVID